MAATRFFEGYPWRFIFTNLETVTTTWCDGLLTKRAVTLTLDGTTLITADVLPNNRQVNEIWTGDEGGDDDPRLAQQNRLLYGFRREGGATPWVCRAAGVVDVLEDQADPDAPVSHITAHDPLTYLAARRVLNADGEIPTADGLLFFAPGNEIIVQLLENTVDADGSCFIDFGQTSVYSGTIEETDTISFRAEQGSMVGPTITDLCTAGHLDIILTPVYDPINRPGITHELSIYNLAGEEKPNAIFGWDRMNRAVTEIDRMHDGTPGNWINDVLYFVGQGGWPIPAEENAASILKYKKYSSQTFFPDQAGTDGQAVVQMAEMALVLAKQGLRTTTITPTPQRSPIALLDYNLGDRVKVYASKNFRVISEGYQRVQGIPIQIDDDGIEHVAGLLCTPDWEEAST